MNVRVANLVGELMPVPDVEMKEITVSTTAVALGDLHAHTSHVFVSWDGADIRMRMDGGAPVAGTNGHLLADGGADVWSKRFAKQVQVIRNAGVDAKLRVTEMAIC